MGLLCWLLPTSVMRKPSWKNIGVKNSEVESFFCLFSTLKVWREGRHQSCQVFIHLPPAGACWCWHITTGKTSLDNNQRKCIRVTCLLTCLCTCVFLSRSRLSCIYLFTFLTCGHGSLVFMSVTKVRKLQIRFQVFIVIFIFISEFNKFVGFLWCQLFIGLSRLIPWQVSSRDEFYWFEKRSSFTAPLFLLLRGRTKRKRAKSSWR